MVPQRFNPPPGWPSPPPGWLPPAGWRPDPAWPQAPRGWVFLLDEPTARNGTRTGVVVAVVASVLGGILLLGVALAALAVPTFLSVVEKDQGARSSEQFESGSEAEGSAQLAAEVALSVAREATALAAFDSAAPLDPDPLTGDSQSYLEGAVQGFQGVSLVLSDPVSSTATLRVETGSEQYDVVVMFSAGDPILLRVAGAGEIWVE